MLGLKLNHASKRGPMGLIQYRIFASLRKLTGPSATMLPMLSERSDNFIYRGSEISRSVLVKQGVLAKVFTAYIRHFLVVKRGLVINMLHRLVNRERPRGLLQYNAFISNSNLTKSLSIMSSILVVKSFWTFACGTTMLSATGLSNSEISYGQMRWHEFGF